ncbi:hypothetical protein KUD11_14025 [Roseovarius sp. LXJ103]|nr:hypothetical protein [Roseovarius carneus]PWE37142.1 hypothetical protein DD563_00715 [Pelagicola sp. LXJ1103]
MIAAKNALTAIAIASIATPLAAQESDIEAVIALELNAIKTTEAGCTLSFMIINGHGSAIDKLVYETVLFDAAGQVDRLTLFDFGALPPARPRVRQFSVPGVACEGLDMLLINGANTCESADLGPAACETGLTVSSRTEIEVQG